MWTLDPRIESSSTHVCDLDLCQVRLSDNAAFPWILLLPRREGAREIIDLCEEDQHKLTREIAKASRLMQDIFAPHKLNVAALGNVVEQLHIHVVARYHDDPLWPDPIWARGVESSYTPAQKNTLIQKLHEGFLGG